MWISRKEFNKLKARLSALEGVADKDEQDTVCDCGTDMIETTTFGTGKQYTCTKCGLKRGMGIEYR